MKKSIAFKGGIWSLTVTAILLAILIVVNLLFSVLPKRLTSFDISSTNLYSITSSTKVVVNAVTKDVTVYWIVQDDEEDSVIENLLGKYEGLSSCIHVEKINPDEYPTFTAQYTSETVANNSLIVVCGEKSRYISYSDIYLTSIDYSTYSYVYSFDGEGALTSAIDYVVSDDFPKIYVLGGHGESELPSVLTEEFEKENLEVADLSLINEDIPEDADCLLLYAPAADISEEERDILLTYVDEGGKLLVLSSVTEDGSLTNVLGLPEAYGVTSAEGLVIESDRNYYAFGEPYLLLPELSSSEITSPLSSDGYYVIVPLAQGLTVGSDTGSASVTSLLTTSYDSFSKVDGYNLSTYSKEDEDIDGPFSLAVDCETAAGGRLIYISSTTLADESFNAYSSGANLNFIMNCLAAEIGESESLSIRTKSLSYNYLTISTDTAALLTGLMVAGIPLAFVVLGIVIIVGRRQKRHETV